MFLSKIIRNQSRGVTYGTPYILGDESGEADFIIKGNKYLLNKSFLLLDIEDTVNVVFLCAQARLDALLKRLSNAGKSCSFKVLRKILLA